MSRIGKKPIVIPKDVKVEVKEGKIFINGPKGNLKLDIHHFVKVKVNDNLINVSVSNPNDKKQRSLWGTFTRLISNMIEGVTKGFEKKLEMVGVGYRAEVKGKTLVLHLDFSHPIEFSIPENIDISVTKNVIKVTGIDKQLVGEVAAKIRAFRKPEPYKGKGIRYSDEIIRRKAGKKAVTTSA
ncbi:50S ribosomal protein L6 [bacterium]|nr:50S ribosomal protein L6 [bacterium]